MLLMTVLTQPQKHPRPGQLILRRRLRFRPGFGLLAKLPLPRDLPLLGLAFLPRCLPFRTRGETKAVTNAPERRQPPP